MPWRQVRVPEVRKRAEGELCREGGGHAWFRCRVMVVLGPTGTRSLLRFSDFSESMDDAREVFVNGADLELLCGTVIWLSQGNGIMVS